MDTPAPAVTPSKTAWRRSRRSSFDGHPDCRSTLPNPGHLHSGQMAAGLGSRFEARASTGRLILSMSSRHNAQRR
eukprot:7381517-Prymnesium_polylepis.1